MFKNGDKKDDNVFLAKRNFKRYCYVKRLIRQLTSKRCKNVFGCKIAKCTIVLYDADWTNVEKKIGSFKVMTDENANMTVQ